MAALNAFATPKTHKISYSEQTDFTALNARMESWSPQEILTWAIGEFGSKLAFATAFGAEGCVLLAMMSGIDGYRDAYLFNVETGYQFAETLDLRKRIMAKYGLNLHLYSAKESVADMETRFGGTLYDKDPDKCCAIRKIAPLNEAVAGYSAWVSAIRRDQSPTRAAAPIVQWDSKFQLVKVNPLVNWTRKDVWKYILDNDVPYNPLHDQGFASIGCEPCTRAVKAGEGERAGRWANFAKTECGLHVANSAH